MTPEALQILDKQFLQLMNAFQSTDHNKGRELLTAVCQLQRLRFNLVGAYLTPQEKTCNDA